tara:strand:+ start:81 stop:398 length:318 start_codon:yes stop_codon:yes gene_type:complete
MLPAPSSKNVRLKPNRKFDVGDRVCQRPRNNTVNAPGSPAPLSARHGVITERIQRKVKSRAAREGFAKRWASKVLWDGSSQPEIVEENRLVHESEFDLYLQQQYV